MKRFKYLANQEEAIEHFRAIALGLSPPKRGMPQGTGDLKFRAKKSSQTHMVGPQGVDLCRFIHRKKEDHGSIFQLSGQEILTWHVLP